MLRGLLTRTGPWSVQAFLHLQAARLHRTKQSTCVRLWLTKFQASNRTSVLVAKETAARGSTIEAHANACFQEGAGHSAVGQFPVTGLPNKLLLVLHCPVARLLGLTPKPRGRFAA